MPQNRVVSIAAWVGCVAGLMCGVEARAQGMVIHKQPAWNVSAKVVGRVIVQAPQSAQHTLMSKVPGDLFGWAAVAIGDVNADGVEDVAIAAPMAEGADGRHGCVYVFSGSDGEKIATLWGQPDERFGSGLDVVADADEDGIADVRIAVMDGVLEPDANKERFADGWRVLSSVSGAELSSGGYVDLPEGVQWHAVADDAHGALELVRIGDSADLDADGAVTEQDFLQVVQIVAEMLQSGPGEPGPKLGDVNGDGAVDQVDLSEVAGKVGQGGGGGEDGGGTGYSSVTCRPDHPAHQPGRICYEIVPGTTTPGDKNPPDTDGLGDGGGDDDNPFDPDPNPGCPDCPGDDDDIPEFDDDDPDNGGGDGDGGFGNHPSGCFAADSDSDGILNEHDCDSIHSDQRDECCDQAEVSENGINWGLRQNDPEDLDCWALHYPLVDIDADTDNTNHVTHRPGRTQTEERLEQVPNAPGKLLLVNSNDTDMDGIPDYADGYDRDGIANTYDDSTPTEQFIPVVVRLMCSEVTASRQARPDRKAFIKFTYSGSDPAQLEVLPSADTPVFMPAPGMIRIWTKDGSDDRDGRHVGDGGDWIKPEEVYEIEELGFGEQGGTVTFYVEGVSPGRAVVSVSSGSKSDALPLSVIGYQFVRASTQSPGAKLEYPELSHPSPTIDARITSLTDVTASPDGRHIVGLLWLAGEVRDALSDQIPGNDGTIEEITVLLNGEPVRHAGGETSTYSMSVSKQEQQSWTRPYAYKGSFNIGMFQTRLRPGINTVRIEATNSMGFVGYYERQFEVAWTHNAREQFNVQFHRLLGLDASSGLEVNWTFTGPNGARNGQLLLSQINETTWSDGTNQVVVSFDEMGAPISATLSLNPGDDLGDLPAWTRDTMPLEVAQGNDNLWLLSESFEPQSLNWLQHSFSVFRHGPAASQGGFFNPFLIEVLGPQDQALDKLEDVQLDGETYQLVTIGERTFLSKQGLGRPSVFLVMRDTRDLETLISERDGPRRDGAVNFAQGFAAGLYDCGENNVVGLWETGESIVNANIHFYRYYNPFTMTWRFIESGDILLEDDAAVLKASLARVSAVAERMRELSLSEGQLLYRAMVLGDPEAINQMDGQWQEAAKLAVELGGIALDAFDEADDYELGQLSGMIFGEVALNVGTGGAGNLLRVRVLPNVIQRIQSLRIVAGNPVIIARLNQLMVDAFALLRLQSNAAHQTWAVTKRRIADAGGDRLQGQIDSIRLADSDDERRAILSGYAEVGNLLDDLRIADAMQLPAGTRHQGFPTYNDYPDEIGGAPYRRTAGIQIHHGFPKAFTKKINEARSPASQINPDRTPALQLTKDENGSELDSDGFHATLNGINRERAPTDVNTMLLNLQQAYTQHGRPDFVYVLVDWLRSEGVSVPDSW